MTLADLLKRGDIRPFKAEPGEIAALLEIAERDLLQGRKNLSDNCLDWSLVVTYNCIFQAARAWMFHKGYRPALGEGHVPVVKFAIATLEQAFGKDIYLLDRLRVKRQSAVYERAGGTTEYEAKYALAFAERFLAFVNKKIASS